jgi:hypothetical protein
MAEVWLCWLKEMKRLLAAAVRRLLGKELLRGERTVGWWLVKMEMVGLWSVAVIESVH